MSFGNKKEKHREATFICLALELKESSNSGLPCTKSDHITWRFSNPTRKSTLGVFWGFRRWGPGKPLPSNSVWIPTKKNRVRLGRTPQKILNEQNIGLYCWLVRILDFPGGLNMNRWIPADKWIFPGSENIQDPSIISSTTLITLQISRAKNGMSPFWDRKAKIIYLRSSFG